MVAMRVIQADLTVPRQLRLATEALALDPRVSVNTGPCEVRMACNNL